MKQINKKQVEAIIVQISIGPLMKEKQDLAYMVYTELVVSLRKQNEGLGPSTFLL